MPSSLRKFCTDPMFSSIIFSPLGPQNRPETVPRLPGYKIDTFLKVFNEKSMVFRSPAAADPIYKLSFDNETINASINIDIII